MTTAIQQTIAPDDVPDNVELLRQILAEEQHREVGYEEAEDIGESLVTLFEALVGAE